MFILHKKNEKSSVKNGRRSTGYSVLMQTCHSPIPYPFSFTMKNEWFFPCSCAMEKLGNGVFLSGIPSFVFIHHRL